MVVVVLQRDLHALFPAVIGGFFQGGSAAIPRAGALGRVPAWRAGKHAHLGRAEHARQPNALLGPLDLLRDFIGRQRKVVAHPQTRYRQPGPQAPLLDLTEVREVLGSQIAGVDVNAVEIKTTAALDEAEEVHRAGSKRPFVTE